ncbi:MAG TPA: GNAT family N-acetyltransferase [Candidatus Dormibacteraeota bacterium]|nr:GNAT family N-acetyltransferase [Candidatus Dormibacteraeota bacterium]
MADEIEIRPLRESEHRAVGDATERAYLEFRTPDSPGWEAYLARIADVGSRAERAVVLVAVDEGVIAGSVTLELDTRIGPGPSEPLAPGEAHIRMLGVAPEHRGRGIARRLMLASIEIARIHGKRVLTLETDPVMTAAQRLYVALGFEPAAPRVRPDGLTLLSYALDIASDAKSKR